MCLIIFTCEKSSKHKLILAANRDEFFFRPTIEAKFWKEYPTIIGGIDLQGGGSWLAMDKKGRWAAVTNFREGKAISSDKLSRGLLVKEFLTNKYSATHYSDLIQQRKDQYGGYNLILGTPTELIYTSNRKKNTQQVKEGVNGLSNHYLNTAWPKVTEGCSAFESIIHKKSSSIVDDLFDLLANKKKANIDALPKTGISKKEEIMLSSRFIESNGDYGTRASTVILINQDNSVFFEERNFNNKSIEYARNQVKFNLN